VRQNCDISKLTSWFQRLPDCPQRAPVRRRPARLPSNMLLQIHFVIIQPTTFLSRALYTVLNLRASLAMRHKKDGFSAKGKKHTNAPRHRPTTHNEDGENTNRRPPFKAACWDLEHCDPKRCSGKRLMHFGLMRELSVGQKFSGVVIS